MFKKGQLIWVKLEGSGSVQRGVRPAIILQNEVGNKYSPTLKIIPLTSTKGRRAMLPTQMFISKQILGPRYSDSLALGEQLRVIDKKQVTRRTRIILPKEMMLKLEFVVLISLGININEHKKKQKRVEVPART